MRAVTIQRFGSPDGMSVSDVPTPVPGPGQVSLRTEAIGVGGVDAFVRRGTIGDDRFDAAGLVLGSEVAGTVTDVGPGVDDSWIGRRVWAFTGLGGGYAEQAVARVDDVAPLPDDVDPADAVTVVGSALVAHFALEHAHLRPGESILVRGATGGIGLPTVSLAARKGASVVAATSSSTERGDRLRRLGATHPLDRSGGGEPGTPDTFDVIVDIVGGPDAPDLIDRLAPNGRLVLVGAVAGWPPADELGARLLSSFQQSRTVSTFSLDTIDVTTRNTVRSRLLADIARGALPAVVHGVLPLADAAEAHRQMDAGTVFGRFVLTP